MCNLSKDVAIVSKRSMVRKIIGSGEVTGTTLTAAAKLERRWIFISGVSADTFHRSPVKYISNNFKVNSI